MLEYLPSMHEAEVPAPTIRNVPNARAGEIHKALCLIPQLPHKPGTKVHVYNFNSQEVKEFSVL